MPSKTLAALILATSAQAFGAPTCADNFSTLLAGFESKRAFQEEHTLYPLRYSGPDATECYPDCPTATHLVSQEAARKLAAPLYPLKAEQAEKQLERKVKISGAAALVRLEQPESDSYVFEFQFERKGGCWKLIAVTDLSL